MPIKMIVADLDGTLLHSDKTISDYTAAILNQRKKNGTRIVFATARPERATRRFQDKIVPNYVIADNGATINNGEAVLRSLLIPSHVRDQMMAVFLASKEVSLITLEAGDRVFTNYDGPPWDIGWNIVHTDFSDGLYADTPKLSVECESTGFLTEVLQTYPDLHLYSNSGEKWHQIMCKESTKTNAIAYIAQSLGFGLESVAAFGDDYNDIEMLQRCGVGVAVANAIDGAKAAADYICGTNDNDGMAKWIEANL